MDILSQIFFSIINFLILLIPLTIISFVIYKLLNPWKEKLIDEKNLSWFKSVFVINFISSFIVIFLIYMYFYFIGIIGAGIIDSELAPTLFEHILFILNDVIRIIIAAIIISLTLVVFEFLAGLGIDLQEERDYSDTIKELLGIAVSLTVFLLLFLFVFDFAFLGLFIYIFFGGVSSPPLILVLV